MGLYRAGPTDGVAWITGASSGIGRALAVDLARRGYTVAVTSRDKERLDELVEESAGLAGGILSYPADVSDEVAMAEIVESIERDAGPLTLVVLNAGNYYPTRGERMQTTNFVRTYDVNILGVVYGLVPAVERMRARRYGQIAIIGSASAYFGWPSAAAYGSSKAALNYLAESLKFDLDKLNIRIQIINPGFIDTPLTERSNFRMPFLMTVDQAVARLARALSHGGFSTSFPLRLTVFLRAVALLPHPLRFALVNRLTGWDRRPFATGKRSPVTERKIAAQPPTSTDGHSRSE
jgi:NAD(P)-dependent dehydrogenase (short-subunit alcohol dehydrogenase family)